MLTILNFGLNIADNSFIVRIVGALLILLVGFILGRIVSLLSRTLLHEFGLDKSVRKRKNVSYHFSLEKQLSSVMEIIIYVVTILFTLNYLRITPYVLLAIAGIIILLFVISLFLSLRDFLPNVFSGMKIKSKKPFVVGDILFIRTFSGVVKKIALFSTILQDGDDTLYVPNMLFAKEKYVVESKNIVHKMSSTQEKKTKSKK